MTHDYDKIVKEKYNSLWPKFQRLMRKKFPVLKFDDIEDIYQESFIILKKNIEKGAVKEDTIWDNYIISVGFNQGLKLLSKTGHIDPLPEFPLSPDHIDPKVFDRYTSYSPDKERAVNIIYEMARQWKGDKGSIIFMRYFQKLSPKEIADEMGYSNERVARSTLSREMRSFLKEAREKLEKEGIYADYIES